MAKAKSRAPGGAVLLRLAVTLSLAVAVAPQAAPAQTSSLGPDCDHNYDWVCVPIASDVDCAGGEGNGPAYVAGPLRVIGQDVYKLDRNRDGYGCEPEGWEPPD